MEYKLHKSRDFVLLFFVCLFLGFPKNSTVAESCFSVKRKVADIEAMTNSNISKILQA